MKKKVLSKRLQAVADMVTPGSRVCEVGCDHGFIPIYLVEQGISGKVIAMDLNPGPLERARQHIEDRNLSAYIETRLSDGLEQLQADEADTVIIAGMGGRLMKKILCAEKDKTTGLRELILQPQSEIPEFRRFIRESGYEVVAEEIVLEEDKFYPMMKVLPFPDKADVRVNCTAGYVDSAREYRDSMTLEDRWGKLLLQQRHPVLKEYLSRELENCKQLLRMIEIEQISEKTEKQLPVNPKINLSIRRQSRLEELQEKKKEIEEILWNW